MATDTLIVLDDSQTVEIEVYDAYANPILVENPIVLVASGYDMNLYFTYSMTTPSEYGLTYAVPSGTEDVSKCGFYTLSSFLLIQGGLEGSYYTNRWFSGTPYVT
jgi:hypothetical protein